MILSFKKYVCVLDTCKRTTYFPHSRNPAKRWIINLQLNDSDDCEACEEDQNFRITALQSRVEGETVPQADFSSKTHTCIVRTIHICPEHAKEFLDLTPEHFERVKKAEGIIAKVKAGTATEREIKELYR